MFYVYVLKSKRDGKLYIGSTNDLQKRFVEHNKQKIKSTNYRVPFILVYYEAYKSEKDARLREKHLKNFGASYGHLKKRIINSLKSAG